jgi:two-component system, chemotaxis family, protein-glutamate methylesterase/glutaminase
MKRSLVVVGASAGGVEALRRVVGDLPGDLSAMVCVVLHLAPRSPSALAAILDRAGPLPCRPALDGEPLEPGHVIVAPPDRHLMITDGKVRLAVRPRENGHRPAVDALFRSAARAQGERVVGVVLSGTRDDGSAGLAMIKAHGGVAIVQDPKDALYPGMPTNALAQVRVDAVAPSSEIADIVVRMVSEDVPMAAVPDNPGHGPGGDAVTSVCPECGGVLSENESGGVVQWACRVGHRYSPESLADAQAEDVEATLWAAVRALEDRQALLDRMAVQQEARGQRRSAHAFRLRAHEAADQALAVRDTLRQAAAVTLREIIGDDEDGDAGEVSYGER